MMGTFSFNPLGGDQIYLCMTVVVRSVVTGPDSRWILMCQHTKVPCCR